MVYSFRISFKKSAADTIQTDLAELELCPDEFESTLRLACALQFAVFKGGCFKSY